MGLDAALYYRLRPWDHAPGILVHAEAGGYAARLNGDPYAPLVRTGGLLVAPSPEEWSRMAGLFGV